MALTEATTPSPPGASQPRAQRTGYAVRLLNLWLLAAIMCALVLLAIAWTIDREAGVLLQQAEALTLEASALKQRARELNELAARWKELSGLLAVVGMLAAALGPGGMHPVK